ncbi:MAG: hypothetical protein ACTSWY_03725 [Promethearchaeota archaeon]
MDQVEFQTIMGNSLKIRIAEFEDNLNYAYLIINNDGYIIKKEDMKKLIRNYEKLN